MELTPAHNKVDQVLSQVCKTVKVLKYVKPLNDKAERAEFLNSSVSNPRLQYREPTYDTQKAQSSLELTIPDDEIGELLLGVRKKLLLENKIVMHLGDEDVVREASLELFGKPTQELIDQANALLGEDGEEENQEEPTLSSEDLALALQEKLDELGLEGWRAMTSKNVLVVTTSYKKIEVPSAKKYGKEAIPRLVNHEIAGHALRSENGNQQPLEIFTYGLMGYWATEEGLAVYNQFKTNTLTKKGMLSYAGRVIAVDGVYKGMTFRETFDKLMAYGKFTKNEAFTLTLRAYRAGGYLKDIIYLDGLQKVQRYAEEDGDFEVLYVGKIALDQRHLIRKLLNAEVLKKPTRMPWF